MQTLARALQVNYPNTIRVQDAAWLGDYYFDTRYPGDDFVVVSEYDARMLLETTKTMAENLITLYDSLRANKAGQSTNYFGGTNDKL